MIQRIFIVVIINELRVQVNKIINPYKAAGHKHVIFQSSGNINIPEKTKKQIELPGFTRSLSSLLNRAKNVSLPRNN